MSDPDFWRDLAEKFRVADPHQFLRADWHYSVKVGEEAPTVAEWRIVGVDQFQKSLIFEFEALARRGGPKIHPLMDSLIGWLETLREYQLNAGEIASEEKLDGETVVAYKYFGSIKQLCLASVDLCKLQESRALETDRLRSIQDPIERIRALPRPPITTRLVEATFTKARSAEPTYPERAKWTKARLKERGWDRNRVRGFHGPDRKTMKRILDGLYVHEGSLEKLIFALNNAAGFKQLDEKDIPTN